MVQGCQCPGELTDCQSSLDKAVLCQARCMVRSFPGNWEWGVHFGKVQLKPRELFEDGK